MRKTDTVVRQAQQESKIRVIIGQTFRGVFITVIHLVNFN